MKPCSPVTQILLALLLATAADIAAATPPPNVIIVYTDDQGSVDANCYGASDLITPNIDRLAATGIRFTQMLAPSAICSASRAGLLTGRFPARAGVASNVSSAKGQAGLPASEVTIAERLKSKGYTTGHVGKWHLGYTPETMPNAQGFDHSFGHMGGCIDNYSHFFYWNGPNRHDLWENGEEIWRPGRYFGDLMSEQVMHFVEQNQKQPFFLYWAINWPHYPLQGTDDWRKRYADLPHPRSDYAAFVSSVDDLLGKLLDHLEALKLRDNTVVIFQSDHGHSVEERTFNGGGSAGPYRGHKGNLFEGGLRVPSVVSWPAGLPEGEVRDQLVTGCDWFPTIDELTGPKSADSTTDSRLDGKSFVSVLNDADAPGPHPIFYWQLGRGDKAQWVVREGTWKLLGNPRDEVLTAADRKEFLVDLENDIGETTNVANAHPDRVTKMRSAAQEFAADIEATIAERASKAGQQAAR